MKAKHVVAVILLSGATAFATVWGYNQYMGKRTYTFSQDSVKLPVNYAKYFNGDNKYNGGPVDFTEAASIAIPATVHIRTKTVRTVSNNLPKKNPFSDLFGIDPDDFFGDRSHTIPEMASGSGVIISDDGIIVTNNHVIDGADEVTVTLSNKKSFIAKVIATDPSSDLAVVKVDARGLPFLVYGNSDDVKIGQWVLAVGYPLRLETTVTAGIVSAKGRSLDINDRQSRSPIESFIQTDAAVNPGNSGGPLINTEGKLIGINSAIASPTGSYAGYSFTIPVNIVKKIVNDLIKYGTPQRAYLGIQYARDDLSEEAKKQAGIKDEEGVFVMEVTPKGAASEAGIQKGDFITKINGISVNTGSEMVGQIATYHPGDKVVVNYRRDGREFSSPIVLRNNSGTTEIVKFSVLDKLGAELVPLGHKDAAQLNVRGGLLVKSIDDKGLISHTKMEEGFIILKVNGEEVTTLDEFRKALEAAGTGYAKIEGVYPNYEGPFTYALKLNSDQ
jgi:serine protease Do